MTKNTEIAIGSVAGLDDVILKRSDGAFYRTTGKLLINEHGENVWDDHGALVYEGEWVSVAYESLDEIEGNKFFTKDEVTNVREARVIPLDGIVHYDACGRGNCICYKFQEEPPRKVMPSFEQLGILIASAIGEASMCWEFPYLGGEFNSSRAISIGNGLIDNLDAAGLLYKFNVRPPDHEIPF